MGEIIWLSSYPKSGNTWTRVFLHNLLLDPDEPTRINTIDAFCLGESDAQHFNQIDPRPLTTLTDKEVAEIRPKVHHMLTRAFPDSVFVKTHNYLGEWQGVPLVTMECTAGAIYILRNPLDVAISFAHHFGISIDAAIEQMANSSMGTPTTDTNVRQIYASWSINVKSWTQHAHPQIHVMRYEDLADKPFETFWGLARFLGLNPSRERLQKAINNSSFKVLQAQENESGFKERSAHSRFFRAGRPGQWRKELSPNQVGAIVTAHREQMERFNYIPPGY